MQVFSQIKKIFKIEKEPHPTSALKDIPIFRTVTPEKIIETRIKPVKIPTILDLGEKLSHIKDNLSLLKNEVATKSWFMDQYEDTSHDIINRLSDINKSLIEIQDLLINTNNLTKNLSDLLLNQRLTVYQKKLSPSEMIINILKDNKRVRYKDIVATVPFSDPTISEHIKILLKNNKITRYKDGKAVYYEIT